MKRRLCQIAAIISLLLGAATMALWARSASTWDSVLCPDVANWSCLVDVDRGSIVFYVLHHGTFHSGQAGQPMATHGPVSGPRVADSLYHGFLGFGCGSQTFPLTGGRMQVSMHALCAPLWFMVLLWLLFACLFLRASRRQLYTGQGFPVLPAAPRSEH